uniref:Uncharacterized protein n=1 Tax=Vespula pensylvanica TaxID=30213 RepID=A0A834PG43_VESPE|nr:hypothetical protein H0235_001291 [Vespula pensylvanica]
MINKERRPNRRRDVEMRVREKRGQKGLEEAYNSELMGGWTNGVAAGSVAGERECSRAQPSCRWRVRKSNSAPPACLQNDPETRVVTQARGIRCSVYSHSRQCALDFPPISTAPNDAAEF